MIIVAATASAMSASGLAGQMNITPATGLQDDVNRTQEQLQDREYSANREPGEVNFIGSVFAGLDKVKNSFIMIYELYELFRNIGLPGWAAIFLSSPIFFIMGVFIIYMITGRRMTVR